MKLKNNTNNRTLPKVLLITSLIANVIFSISIAIKTINKPQDRQGVLIDDITVIIPKEGSINESTSFTLPKGMVVQDASPRWFDRIAVMEPYRFQIILTSDGGELVDYSVDKKKYTYFSSRYTARISKIK